MDHSDSNLSQREAIGQARISSLRDIYSPSITTSITKGRTSAHNLPKLEPLNPETCSLEQFAAFIATRSDKETLARYAQIIEDREWLLFAEADAEMQVYDDAWNAMHGHPTLFDAVAA